MASGGIMQSAVGKSGSNDRFPEEINEMKISDDKAEKDGF